MQTLILISFLTSFATFSAPCTQNLSVPDAIKLSKREPGYTIYIKRCPFDECVCLDGKDGESSIVAKINGKWEYVYDNDAAAAKELRKQKREETEKDEIRKKQLLSELADKMLAADKAVKK